jgi:vacuolar-type H+-ATPase subunit I/STV1
VIQKAHEILSTVEIEDEGQRTDSSTIEQPTATAELKTTADSRPAADASVSDEPAAVVHRPLAQSQESRSDEERKEEEQNAEAEIIAAVRANDARLINELFERIAGTHAQRDQIAPRARAAAWLIRDSPRVFFLVGV